MSSLHKEDWHPQIEMHMQSDASAAVKPAVLVTDSPKCKVMFCKAHQSRKREGNCSLPFCDPSCT